MSQAEIQNSTASAPVTPVYIDAAEGISKGGPAVATEREQDVRTLAAGAGVALGGRFIGRGVRLGVDVLLAHVLGPASFGLYAIGWISLRVIGLFSPLGLDAGVIRFASPSWKQDDAKLKGAISQSLEFSAISGLILGALFYLLAPWLGSRVFSQPMLVPVFRGFAFALPLMTCLKVASAATRVSQRMKFSAYAEEISQPAVALLLIVAFYFCGWELQGVLLAFVFSFGFGLVLAVHYVHRLFPEVSSTRVKPHFAGKELLLFSLPTSFSIVFGMLLLWVDRLFVGYYKSATEAGIYHAVSQLAIALGVILSAFGAIITPMIAELYHRGKQDRLEELFRVSTKWSLYVSIPAFLLMCFVPHQIMSVIFGEAYVVGWIALPILGLGQLINSGTGPVGTLLVMTGSQNKISALTGFALVANVASLVILVPRWGMAGAAVGTMATVGALSLASVVLARKTTGVWPYDRRYTKGLIAAGVAAASLLLIRLLPVTSPVVLLVTSTVVSTLVFGIVLIGLGLDHEDREFIGMVLNRALPPEKAQRLIARIS